MFIVMLTGDGMWIYYGISKPDVAVIATNILAVILNITMLALKLNTGKIPAISINQQA